MKNKTNFLIISLTVFIHISGFLLFSVKYPKTQTKPKKKLLVVTKIIPKVEPLIPSYKHSSQPVKTVPKKIKKQAAKKPPIKKIAKKKPIRRKKKTSTPSKKIRKNLEKNLAKIKKVTPKNSPPPPTSKEDKSEAINIFTQRISTIFREALILPEKGAVKLSITVQANGKIGTIETLYSESEMNLDYLKMMLPKLTLPKPQGAKEINFAITFCDD